VNITLDSSNNYLLKYEDKLDDFSEDYPLKPHVKFTAMVVKGDSTSINSNPEILGVGVATTTMQLPPIVILAPETLEMGKTAKVVITMSNPLSVDMTNVQVRVRGWNLGLD